MNLIDVAIVTGAGRGIGKAVAQYWAEQGIPVLCISKSLKAKETSNEINNNGGSAEFLICDLEDFIGTERKVKEWLEVKGFTKIGLYLAAGILGPKGGVSDTDLVEWESCFRVNVFGNLAVLKALLDRMKQNNFARIVYFSGGGAAFPSPVFSAYSASKTTIVRIVENLHEEFKNQGDFHIVALAPGAINTDMLKTVVEAGVVVEQYVDIAIPIKFIAEFTNSKNNRLSGRFVHACNDWKALLDSDNTKINDSYWKLRVAHDK